MEAARFEASLGGWLGNLIRQLGKLALTVQKFPDFHHFGDCLLKPLGRPRG
jgi:hypothetical protein